METLVAAADLVVRRIELRALGTSVTIALCEKTAGTAMLEDVPRWFARWERSLSPAKASELSRVNDGDGAPTRVTAILWSAVHLALDAAAWTRGIVAPSPTWRAIKVDDRTSRITVPSGVRIDLDATARSWTADRAAARLAGCGVAWVLVGGELAISGPRPNGRAWALDLVDASRPGERIASLRVDRGGVATAEAPRFVDPLTLETSRSDVRSATVIGATAAEAAVAARYVLACGAREGLAWIETELTLAAIVTLHDGRVLESKRAAAHLAA